MFYLIIVIVSIIALFVVYRKLQEKTTALNDLTKKLDTSSEELLRERELNQKMQDAAIQERVAALDTEVVALKNTKAALNADINAIVENKNNICANFDEIIEAHKRSLDEGYEYYHSSIQRAYDIEDKKFEDYKADLNQQKSKLAQEVDSFKGMVASINQLKAREEADKTAYCLQLDQNAIYEINVIKSIESQLSDPRPLRMLIWTTYYSKKANELCSRVLGTNTVCGIYKITNLLTNESYIGQSCDMRERFREHLKCGLGIDTPAGNKLYAAMQKHGITNFSFEIIEKAPREQLDELEVKYIDLLQTYDYGYNSNRGNKKGK